MAVALLLALPSLAIGFFSDDYVFLDFLEHRIPWPPWWDLYRFVTPDGPEAMRELIAMGRVPWWSAPDLHLHFVRPLASALLALDHAAFGRAAMGWHLHSLGWYALLLVAAGALFRRLLPPASATLALALFALSDATVMPYAWPSSRHALVAAVFVTVALTAHVRLRLDGWRAGRWITPLALVVGLLASEEALGGVAFAVAFDVFGRRRGTARERLVRALPLAGIALIYLLVYSAAGGGARGSGGYVSPLSEPVAFLATGATRLPVLLADAVLGVPADFANAGIAGGLAIAGCVAAACFGLLWAACAPLVPRDERAALGWLLLGAAGATATSIGGFPGARCLLVANLGLAPLLATMLRHGFAAGRFAVPRRAGVGVLAFVHLGLSPLLQLANEHSARTISRATVETAHVVEREVAGSTDAFLVAASDPMAGIYDYAVRASETGAPSHCEGLLSSARADVTITRTGVASFTLEPRGTTLLQGPFEDLYRSRREPLHVGDELRVCSARVRVVAMAEGLPSRIAVATEGDLDAPGVAWLVWERGAIRRLTFPAIGESTTIAWTPGPSGAF